MIIIIIKILQQVQAFLAHQVSKILVLNNKNQDTFLLCPVSYIVRQQAKKMYVQVGNLKIIKSL